MTDTDKDKETTNKETKTDIDKETVGKETIPAVLPPKPGELTAKQQTFVNEYLVDLNGSKAAARAGYSPNHGYRLLYHIPVVAQAIAKALEERARRTEVTADRVVQQLARVAFVDMKDVVKYGPEGIRVKKSDEIDGTILSEVSETVTVAGRTIRVKLSDRMKALELLGRHLGMFPDKVDVKIEGNVSFENQLKGLLNRDARKDGDAKPPEA